VNRLARRMARLILCLLCMSGAPTLRAAPLDFTPYLPRTNSVEAEYVVVTPDPLYDGYGQRLQAAMHRHAAWLRAYTEQHKGANPLPYHPNFGVPEAQYRRYQDPLNQFITSAPQRIRMEVRREAGRIRLALRGQRLLFDTLLIDANTPTLTTARDRLPFREIVAPGRATFPPGAHAGVAFMSDIPTIKQRRFRESVLVGRLTGTNKGVIQYSINTPGNVAHAYVTYALR
jgi:hypothetical protein